MKNIKPLNKERFWSVGERLLVTCHALDDKGNGLCEFKGFTFCVSGLLPGETAEVEVQYKRTHSPMYLASLQLIIQASPMRSNPVCAVYGVCGGCSLQHMKYEAQLLWKRSVVQQAFSQLINSHVIIQSCVPAQNLGLWGRRHAKYVASSHCEDISSQNNNLEHQPVYLGSYRRNSHQLVLMDDCKTVDVGMTHAQQLISEEINCLGMTAFDENKQSGQLRSVLVRSSLEQKLLIGLVFYEWPSLDILNRLVQNLTRQLPLDGVCAYHHTKRGNVLVPFTAKQQLLYGQSYQWEPLLERRLRVSLRSFVQANHQIASLIYSIAASLVNLRSGDTLVDLYCGTGALGLTVFLQHPDIFLEGIEENPFAHEDSLATLKEWSDFSGKISFKRQSAESWVQEQVGHLRYDGKKLIVLMNPPRKGCDIAVMDWLIHQQPKQIIYISCFLDSLCRDLAALCSLGYRISKVVPFDLHPQTSHIETLVVLDFS